MMKPPWALSIWYDSDWLYVEVPGAKARSHILRVPHNSEGIFKLLALLKARDHLHTISTEGSPTQDQINHIHYGLGKKASKRAKLDMTNEEYQLTLAICRDIGLVK
jgi:hypothetical protein